MRSDNDTWDITTSVGATALGVAVMRARETARADALFHDPYAKILIEATGLPQWRALVSAELDDADPQVRERYTAHSSFMVARTCYFDRYFTDAAAAGIRQFVILAAGLDARAFRLDWPAGSTVYELDQPKVLQFKADALADGGVTAAVDRREIAVDLRQDWPAALRDKGFDPAVPTAWLAEGLLRYLPADAQDRLFENIAALSAPGSRFAANGGTTFPWQSPVEGRGRLLERVGIDLDLANLVYEKGDRSDPRDWFPAHGWTATSTTIVGMMAELGRPVPESVREFVDSHMLMSATLTQP